MSLLPLLKNSISQNAFLTTLMVPCPHFRVISKLFKGLISADKSMELQVQKPTAHHLFGIKQ